MTEADPDEHSNLQPQAKPKSRRAERVVPPTEVNDQIFLSEEATARFNKWLQTINERFEGFGKISKNDIADFLFRKHAAELSEQELRDIGNEFYDEVHWLNWALEKITQSKNDGVVVKLGDLISRKNASTATPNRASSKSSKRSKTRATPLEQITVQRKVSSDETEII